MKQGFSLLLSPMASVSDQVLALTLILSTSMIPHTSMSQLCLTIQSHMKTLTMLLTLAGHLKQSQLVSYLMMMLVIKRAWPSFLWPVSMVTGNIQLIMKYQVDQVESLIPSCHISVDQVVDRVMTLVDQAVLQVVV